MNMQRLWALLDEGEAEHGEGPAAQLDTLLSSVPFGCMWVDRDLRIVGANQAFALAVGIRVEDQIGRRPSEVNSDLGAKLEPLLGRALKTGEAILSSEPDPDAASQAGYFSACCYPLRTRKGQVTGAGAVLPNAAVSKYLEEIRGESTRYWRIIETSQEGIWILDPAGNTIFANARMAEMLGYTAGEMMNRHLFSFMDEEAKARAEMQMERRRQGIKEEHDFRFLRSDGTHLWTMISTNPIIGDDGQVQCILGMITDITPRKQLEEQLRELLERANTYASELHQKNEQLKKEIAEREQAEHAMLRMQQETIRALSTPIIQVWDGVLALPVIGTVDGTRATQMMEALLGEIVRTGAQFAILDVTGMQVVDAAAADSLLSIVRAASLLGSRCMVSGISPSIAQTMVEIGIATAGVATFGTLQDALRYALDQAARSGAEASSKDRLLRLNPPSAGR